MIPVHGYWSEKWPDIGTAPSLSLGPGPNNTKNPPDQKRSSGFSYAFGTANGAASQPAKASTAQAAKRP